MALTYSRDWLLAALTVSAAVIALAPLIGQLTAGLRDLAQGQYALVLGIIVGLAALAAVGAALFSIRDRRRERYAYVASAVVVAVAYAAATRTGVADVDAAERFHFIEYGVIAVLFYKAWRPASDGAVILMPLVAGALVGTLEEWLQWFVPARVGEVKDVALNLFAVGAGVLLALGLDPPPRVTMTLLPRSRRHLGWLTAVLVMVGAAFFQSVHLGHEIADPVAGVFRSRYSADDLHATGRARAEQWRTRPPTTWSRYSREDQYLTEGVAHVRRRNERWDEGHRLAARQENFILERYYAPVLDTPSYISASGHRWPESQRAEAEQIRGPGFMIYESDALTYPVVTWSPGIYWLVVSAAVVLTLRRTV